jgi:hypothetical protein
MAWTRKSLPLPLAERRYTETPKINTSTETVVERDSVTGRRIGYGLGGPGIESRCGRGFPPQPRPAVGPTLPSKQ